MRTTNRFPGRSGPSSRERRLSYFLLGLLICIGLGVFSVQFAYDPSLWRDRPSSLPAFGTRSAAAPAATAALAVPGLKAMSPPEDYNARTLSDKINGKAELYLSAGFERLETRRFVLADDPDRWLELFVYEMSRRAGAFAVYSQQRRDMAQPLDLAADAYRSANGIFLVQGRYYLEVVGSDDSWALMAKMTALARAFIESHPAEQARTDERTLFPEKGLVPDSIALNAENAFGFEPFNRMYTAQYGSGEQGTTVFLSRRASAGEAAELAEAYVAYLVEYGGRRIEPAPDAPPVVIVEIMGLFEVVFQKGDLLAGVHEALGLPEALSLAERLYRHLNEVDHAP